MSHSEIETNDEPYCKFPPRICHPRRQKARGREAVEIKIPGVRKLRVRIERGSSLWAATPKPCLTIIMNFHSTLLKVG